MKIGDKIIRRSFHGKKPDGHVGIVKKIDRKWKNVLILWEHSGKEYWHSIDDVEVIK